MDQKNNNKPMKKSNKEAISHLVDQSRELSPVQFLKHIQNIPRKYLHTYVIDSRHGSRIVLARHNASKQVTL